MSAEAMLRAIGADRPADAPRARYADLLLKRGDPRGEFIHLQLAAARRPLTAVERAHHDRLLKGHRQRWLGPHANLFHAHKFERGFLTEVWLPEEALGRPLFPDALEWLTVERVSGAHAGMGEQLHRLYEMSVSDLEVVDGDFPSLRKLAVYEGSATRWKRLLKTPRVLPSLEHLFLVGKPTVVKTILASAVGKRLAELEVHYDWFTSLEGFKPLVFASNLKRFTLGSVVVVRVDGSWELHFKPPPRGEPLRLNGMLGKTRPEGFSRVRLVGKWTPFQLDFARDALKPSPMRGLFEAATEKPGKTSGERGGKRG